VLGFAVPSPKVIRRQFMEKTDAVRQWLKGVLRGKAVCISFDVWTRTSLSESYLGVCVRVRLGEKMATFLLDLEPITCPHTADRIRLSLDAVLDKWGLEEANTLGYCCDSASTNCRALLERVLIDSGVVETEREGPAEFNAVESALLQDELDLEMLGGATAESLTAFSDGLLPYPDRQSTQLEPPPRVLPKRLPCNCHSLANCYSAALRKDKVAQDLMQSVMKFVSAVRRSTKHTQMLKELASKSLLGLSKTRWMATFQVLSRLILVRGELDQLTVTVTAAGRQMRLLLDWDLIGHLLELLRPGNKAILAMEGRLYPSSPLVIPSVLSLRKMADAYASNADYPFRLMAEELSSQITHRWRAYLPNPLDAKIENPCWLVCAVLDPFNSTFLEQAQLLEPALAELRRWAMREAAEIWPDLATGADPGAEETLPPQTQTQNENFVPPWMKTKATAKATGPKPVNARFSHTELLAHVRHYCDLAREGDPATPSDDFRLRALHWWLSAPTRVKLLEPVAMRALTLGARSSAWERAFSCAAWHLSGNKRSANAENLNARCFLSFNWSMLAGVMN
jgi:hypothetical protein